MTVAEAKEIIRKHKVNHEPGKNHGLSPAIFRAADVILDELESKERAA